MSWIQLYTIFAITTAIVVHFDIVRPSLIELAISHPDDVMIQNLWLSYAVFFLASIMLSPVMIFVCLSPKLSDYMKNQLVVTLRDQKI